MVFSRKLAKQNIKRVKDTPMGLLRLESHDLITGYFNTRGPPLDHTSVSFVHWEYKQQASELHSTVQKLVCVGMEVMGECSVGWPDQIHFSIGMETVPCLTSNTKN